MLNTYQHLDADRLVPSVTEALDRALLGLVDLLGRARAASVPGIDANDNFGRWRSRHGEILDMALSGRHPELVEPLRPDDDSPFVVKARHSIFYETPLAYLLRGLDVDELVLTGQVIEQCVLYSAPDAHIRHLGVTVPRDAVAHIGENGRVSADAGPRL
ncbi:isochorismatase family cysteine hydrolase [Streptomyces sp. NPDC006482]|uniref:isochorismatase family cysteine hydrolase n=1 Tax=Streptomyces sp. NPDC006482 TaxID=3154306 RepID=UPI00339E5BBA